MVWVRARPSSSRRSTSMPITTRSSSTSTSHQVRPGRQRDHRHRVRVDRVGLAAVAGGEDPHLRGQLRRHVDDDLTVVHEPVRDVPADAVAALDRPDPVRVPAARGEHLGVAGLVGAEPPTVEDVGPRSSMTSIVAERLCGSIPMITPIACTSLPQPMM